VAGGAFMSWVVNETQDFFFTFYLLSNCKNDSLINYHGSRVKQLILLDGFQRKMEDALVQSLPTEKRLIKMVCKMQWAPKTNKDPKNGLQNAMGT
jgi:hypothetical protein